MTLNDIAQQRLLNQQIIDGNCKTPGEVIAHMGAMQAQDFIMAKWALGVRLPGSTNHMIEEAFDSGDIIRIHTLRPTWHFVAKDDVRKLLQISAARILASMRSRDKQLELTESIFSKSNAIIEKALQGGQQLTRDEIAASLQKDGIRTDDNRASHLMMRAEMLGLVCSGALKNKKQTYALLDEKVPQTKTLHKEEILAELAHRYFVSHGPATLKDFVWWSGVSPGEARQALENSKHLLHSEQVGTQTYWMGASQKTLLQIRDSVLFLPAFDEFIISYTDRTATLAVEVNKRVVSSNGIFRPVVVVNGQVKGLWKRTIVKEKLRVEVDLFFKEDTSSKSLIKKALEPYAHFLGLQEEVVFSVQR